MNILAPTMGPGRGLTPDASGSITATFNGTAVAVGNIVMFDPGATTDSATPGNGSRYERCSLPTTAGLVRGLFAVVTDAGTGVDEATIKVSFYGRHTVTTNGSVAAGSLCIGVNGAGGLAPASGAGTGQKIIAISEVADTGTVGEVLFNGVEGFGLYYSNS